MVVVVDNSLMFRRAEEIYERFETAYNLMKRYEASGEPINDATENVIKMFCYDAFKIHLDIRETFSGLNDRLAEMIEKGFLKLKGEDLSPFDPVTKKYYFDNLFEV